MCWFLFAGFTVLCIAKYDMRSIKPKAQIISFLLNNFQEANHCLILIFIVIMINLLEHTGCFRKKGIKKQLKLLPNRYFYTLFHFFASSTSATFVL